MTEFEQKLLVHAASVSAALHAIADAVAVLAKTKAAAAKGRAK